jgi:hypothetical protein
MEEWEKAQMLQSEAEDLRLKTGLLMDKVGTHYQHPYVSSLVSAKSGQMLDLKIF